ncbi:hypothetical protein KHA96_09800 [Bacillus sp. FJAT-49711]|uniref:hypothetical protein n=1 Tax=Bacillus sp. FJAT-49711 TaxID=2833585 RepID=UPI001BC98866|nr:hypothetical protein [Bacillus sp. FJAT-49711]MBS4218604.1 hypothetical protein [Bacillus sp. FJAT-49711]
MFGFTDLIGLIMSAFIILPVVVFLRELGYLITSGIFGVKNPRVTIGTGPRIFKLGMFDIRKYYHIYSWFSYDSIKKKSRLAYISIYAGPILTNLCFALLINALLSNGGIQSFHTFWNRFIFYAFYYILFDCVPMITVNGKPNNGMIIYELLRYGKRVDYNKEPFIPSTSEVEEQYQKEWRKEVRRTKKK